LKSSEHPLEAQKASIQFDFDISHTCLSQESGRSTDREICMKKRKVSKDSESVREYLTFDKQEPYIHSILYGN
jgi:hypothetical protein